MGTNYYAKHPGMDGEGLHIGKRSAGWEFTFRAHPEFGLTSSTAWSDFLDHPWVAIFAEYGVQVTASEFWEDVAVRSVGAVRRHTFDTDMSMGDREWRDAEGYTFFDAEFC